MSLPWYDPTFWRATFGFCGDPRVLVDLAREAEEAGWDGFFLWDHIELGSIEPTLDPWVALGAMAQTTEGIRLGTLITPLPRRRIAKLAREAVTLDHLSNGRAILGIGAGAARLSEYTAFGDEGDPKVRGAMLDEGIDLLAALWSGKPVKHEGTYYRAETNGFQSPVQTPRIRIWVAATWPAKKPLRRAARWDGVVPIIPEAITGEMLQPDQLAELVAYVRQHREGTEPVEVVQYGMTADAGDTEQVRAYAEAGATWWVESITVAATLETTRERIRSGPPRYDG
jgi:alkanesulfonate monooxygenase SsuD/methylene tetrahydromethanopterin reductase-like flavin-dependent oxidoreductase (luciferase family)